MENYIQFSVSSSLFTTILFFGIFGNILGLIVFFKRKNLSSIGPLVIYKALFFTDIITLVQIVAHFLKFSFSIDVFVFSSFECKILNYIIYLTCSISPYLLVYISIDRLIAIRFTSKRQFIRSLKNQFIFVFLTLIFNSIFYIPSITGIDVLYIENQTFICSFTSYDYQNVLTFMDLVNRCFFPFISMSLFSSMLVVFIFKSRRRVLHDRLTTENRQLIKDIKFSITSVVLNLFFLFCSMPVNIVTFIPDFWMDYGFELTAYLFFFTYAGNFYIFYLTNSIIRKEFHSLFKF